MDERFFVPRAGSLLLQCGKTSIFEKQKLTHHPSAALTSGWHPHALELVSQTLKGLRVQASVPPRQNERKSKIKGKKNINFALIVYKGCWRSAVHWFLCKVALKHNEREARSSALYWKYFLCFILTGGEGCSPSRLVYLFPQEAASFSPTED